MRDFLFTIIVILANGAIFTIPFAVIGLIVALFSKNRKKAIKAPLIYIAAAILVYYLCVMSNNLFGFLKVFTGL